VTRFAIRPAAPADLEWLPAIEAAADELFAQAGIGPLPSGTSDPGDYAEALQVLVAGTPVYGFATIEEVDGEAHLEQLSVHPEHARSGVGTALLEAVCAWATDQGYDVVTLSTFAEVPWNGPFYATRGFEAVDDPGPELRALRANEGRLGLDALGPRVVMRRRLGGDVMSG